MKRIINILLLLFAINSYGQDTIVNTVEEKLPNTYESKRTLHETKEFITRIINDYGWEKDSNTRRLRATFENNMLRVVVMNKKYSEPVNSGFLYDFSRVHKFQKISYRAGNIAYLNIWVDFVADESYRKMDKRKLVLEIHHHRQAEELMAALRHLNKLLLEMEEPVEKF